MNKSTHLLTYKEKRKVENKKALKEEIIKAAILFIVGVPLLIFALSIGGY